MLQRRPSATQLSASLPQWLLLAFLVILTVAGGASRADTLGQTIVRFGSAAVLLTAVLLADRPRERVPVPVRRLFVAAAALVLLQLVPLPPAMWLSLPERDLFAPALVGDPSWRALSIEPGATINAAASLLIPLTAMLLTAGVPQTAMPRVVAALLVAAIFSAVVGVMQLSGSSAQSPLVNGIPGAVSGLFANRNHLALFLAMGCVLAPVWASLGEDRVGWRMPIALAVTAFLLMVIMSGGSRAGLALGIGGAAAGLLIARRAVRRTMRRLPRRARVPAAALVVAALICLIAASIYFNRAQSFDRALALNAGDDMRTRALPTLLVMWKSWYLVGSGFGSFDTLFRVYEPFDLLKLSYFNHAHNDYIEVALTGGVPALVILVAAIGWWLVASVRVWRRRAADAGLLAKAGSVLLLQIAIASGLDYPARTPLIMAVLILAAVWLGRDVVRPGEAAALPDGVRHL